MEILGVGFWVLLGLACAGGVGVLLRPRLSSRLARRAIGARTPLRAARCPHLGCATDGTSPLDVPSDDHRCYAYGHQDRVDLAHQRHFCLGEGYARCPFAQVAAPGPALQAQVAGWRAAALARGRSAWCMAPEVARATLAQALARVRAVRRPAHRPSLPPAVATSLPDAQAAPAADTGAIAATRFPGRVQQLAMARLAQVVRGARRLSRALPSLAVPRRTAAPEPGPAASAAPIPTSRPAVEPVAAHAERAAEPAGPPDLIQGRGVSSLLPATLQPVLASPAARYGATTHRDQPLSADGAGAGASLLGRVAEREADLLERGIAAVEAGHEAEAYTLFSQAVELNPLAERAWFWRAKTAQTLDEVIHCLQEALALDPTNEHIRTNLAWAIQRREREATITSQTRLGPAPADATARSVRTTLAASRPVRSGASPVRVVARVAGACAALALAWVWIAGSLPTEIRGALSSLPGEVVTRLPALDLSALLRGGRAELVPGTSALAVLPYVLGILALFVAAGLRSGER